MYICLNIIEIMKKNLLFSVVILALYACNEKKQVVENNIVDQHNYVVFGDSITTENAINQQDMLDKYLSLNSGDTINVKFGSQIISTCANKGCWMTLDLGADKEAFVKFKNYDFFVPKHGAEQHYAVVSGKAFIGEISVDQLKHYAKDAGKSQQAIDSIVSPKKTYRFIADGVLIADTK